MSKIIIGTLIILNSILMIFCLNLSNEIKTSDKALSGMQNTILYQLEIERNIDLSNILKKYDTIVKPKLIYVYSKDECGKCIDADISVLKDIFNGPHKKNITIFPILKECRETKVELRDRLDGFNYIRGNPLEVSLPQYHNRDVRFFAVLYPSGKISHIYFPTSTNLESTLNYLEFVKNIYHF